MNASRASAPSGQTGEQRAKTAPAARFVTIDEAHAGQRIDNFLIGTLKSVPKSHIYRVLRSGEVRVNKGRIDQTYRLAMGDVVRIPPLRDAAVTVNGADGAAPKKVAGPRRRDLGILYEDDELLAVDKPAGMAVHGGSGISQGVIEMLRAWRPDARFLELVHRLDRETSGVLLLAKKRSTLIALHAMLRGDSPSRMDKHYLALVKGRWPHERRHLRGKLARYVTAGGEHRVALDDDGRESHTIVERREAFSEATLLDCEIRTGRTHQIRVHLAGEGFPILGDDKYGDFALNKRIASPGGGGLKRMFLHAHRLGMAHPNDGRRLVIEAPLPPALAQCLQRLRTCATG